MKKSKINLRERVTALLAESNKPCTAKRYCAPLQGVIDVFDGRRPGISSEQGFNYKTGQMTGPRVVLFTRQGEFAELSFCPFCGHRFKRAK